MEKEKRFYLITNSTITNATFKNTANTSDTASALQISMVHTTGKDGDYCRVPDCSDQDNFDSNHMTVKGDVRDSGINIAFWHNPGDNQIYYSLDGAYAGKKEVEGSKDWREISLLISPKPINPEPTSAEAEPTITANFFKF